MIYFDQAASSFPKPSEVTEAMVKTMKEIGANPGRGGHALAREAATIIQQTREKAAELFGCSNPKKALFYQNATVALNQALKGLTWQEGDHIITTSAEHNSVRRPLEYLKQTYGVNVSYIPWTDNKQLFIETVRQEIRPETKLMAITHASNVTGEVLPLQTLTMLAKEHHILTVVDGSQTVGHLPIHMKNQGIDMLAFPGHKGLLGPQGTGMLLVEGELDLKPLHHGGTGYFSESITQPEQWPEKLESGTLNTPGIAGLYAALKVYEQHRLENVPRETLLIKKLITGLKKIPGVTCYSPSEAENSIPIAAFNIMYIDSQEIAMVLDSHYEIAVRAGLHCSPLAHDTLNTADQGVVRASLNRYNTEKEIDVFLQAIEEIATAYQAL
ncbi:MAG TPA: aminotransferase class V-fold PLP-dependent enzyme [Virgibacillus sp.]|nr:aminotransferase class V-fold PLP-dependent enzyme [Virgibacillus sp.]